MQGGRGRREGEEAGRDGEWTQGKDGIKPLLTNSPEEHTTGADLLLGWEAPLTAWAAQELPTISPGRLGLVPSRAPTKYWGTGLLSANHRPSS